jgi:hypothetical protein
MQAPHHGDPMSVGLDIMAVAEPQCWSAVVAYLPAGTTIHPLQLVDGFYGVRIGSRIGFIPRAACHPITRVPQPHHPVYRSLAQRMLLRSAPIGRSTMPSRVLRAGEMVLVLGEHEDWQLVQCADGRMGFLAPAPLAFADAYGISRPVGCLHAGLWRALGFGWALANWLMLASLLRSWMLVPSRWEALLLVSIEFGLWRMMWRGPRVDPERIFLEGVLIQSMLSLFIAIISW